MKKIWGIIFTLMILLVMVACGKDDAGDIKTSGNEHDEKDSSGEITGELEFYTSQPDVDAEQLVKAFNEEYPDVEVNIFRSGTEDVISKINAEHEAGDVQADVLLVADAVTFESLKEKDMLLEYVSPETKFIPEEFIDSDGTYTGTKIMATGLVINTDKVSESPSSWQVLTSEEARDQIVMPSPLYSGAAAYNLGVLTRNQDFGWEFYENLKDNTPMITEGNGAVMENVSSGQKSFGMVVDYLVARAANDGSPVELVYPEEGVPVITEPVGIMKNTEAKDAATAFVDFILSETGQKMQADIGYTPIREDITPPEGLKSIEDIKVIHAPLEELYQNRESDKEKFDEMYAK